MPLSNYPNGFLNGVTIRGVPIQQTFPGKVFYVSNSTSYTVVDGVKGSNSNPGTYQRPFSTIDYAIGRCKAGRGDIIMVMPGHAETISTATSLNLDVAGIAIVGLGQGTARPSITLDTATTTTIPVSAANIAISNIQFVPNFADIVSCFTTTTAASFTLENCAFKTGTAVNFTYIIDTDATANRMDGLYINNCSWIETATTAVTFLKQDGNINGLTFTNNYTRLGVNNNVASWIAIATGKAVLNLICTDNSVYRLNTDTATGGLLITTDVSTNTGIIARNFAQHADTAAEILVTASSGFGFFNNYASGVAGASGYLLPAADS